MANFCRKDRKKTISLWLIFKNLSDGVVKISSVPCSYTAGIQAFLRVIISIQGAVVPCHSVRKTIMEIVGHHINVIKISANKKKTNLELDQH